jgi:hypothetical protein
VAATIVGTAGADRIVGTAHRDVIVGLGGDDRIVAGGGDDLVCGGPGDDVISGDAGDDRLRGDAGRDVLYGGSGADRLRGGTGSDWLWGGRGADVLVGWRGDDRLHGGAGLDRGDGGPGIDLCTSPAPPGARGCENTERITRIGGSPALSAHGRYVAFSSRLSNLVPGDTNGAADAFVRDRRRHVTTRGSVATGGQQANGDSYAFSISADGARVAFVSTASNLVPGDTNNSWDVFVHDVRTGVTTRASVATGGGHADGDSGIRGGVELSAELSADGRFVAFASDATNLVPGDTNDAGDVFVHDMRTGVTTRASVATGGGQAEGDSSSFKMAISADGRYVAFDSTASDLVPNDTNDVPDVFVHDMRAGVTRRVSVASDGSQATHFPSGDRAESVRPAISADGRYVAFDSTAIDFAPNDTNHALDIFVHDMRTGVTKRVSTASDGSAPNGFFSAFATISANGRYVAYLSDATDIVSPDTNTSDDVFLHDARTGRTTRVSVLTTGGQIYGDSGGAEISADGCCVAFGSAPEANNGGGLFVRLVH